MENTDNSDEEKIMDFESGIDTWVIDKEESDVSQISAGKSKNEMKAMDKENIKQFTSSCDKKSLRFFRIPKHVSYHELTSESDSDSKRKSPVDKDDFPCRKKIQKLQSSHMTNSSLNSVKDFRKDKESLSAEEIAISLSESDGSCDSNQEKNRERLHSIENVSSKVDGKDKCIENSPPPLKSSFTCSTCSCVCHSSDELSTHENTHKRANLLNIQQTSGNVLNKLERQGQLDSTGSVWNKRGFLDTFKNHLMNRGVISVNITDRNKRGNKHSEAEERITETSKKNTFKCDMCNYFCSEMLVLKSHQILFHSEGEIMACEYCDYQTSLGANLATHMGVHFQLDCPHCDYQCSLRAGLETHIMKYHPDNNGYKCKKCDFSCKSQKKYNKHLQLHTISHKYQCADCSVYFTNKQILKLHIKQHIALQKKFRCAQCEMCFPQKKLLKHHMRSHEQLYKQRIALEKTFKCAQCDKCFTEKKLLKRHIKSHEQLFVCDTCNSKFTQKNFLRIHMKVHNRVALKCEKCNSQFTRKNYLKLHMRIHLPKNLKCEYCPFQCTDSHELSRHICINKLYEVQKRSLNFQREDASNDMQSDTKYDDEEKSANSIMKTVTNEINKRKTIINVKTTNLKIYKKKKHKKNRSKLLSLRQNLPSRNSQILMQRGRERRNGELPRSAKRNVQSKQTAHKIRHKKKNSYTGIRNSTFKVGTKQSSWIVNNREYMIRKALNKPGKKVKKEQLTRWFNCTKVLFHSKSLPKELFVEPVRFFTGTFVQCYYQSQQPAILQEHLEQHVRQNTLLSCRFCKYKTNSRQLLQRHNAKNHTWDPVVINRLFS